MNSAALKGSIVAIVTPFKEKEGLESGAIDLEAFRVLVQWHIKSGTSGIVIAGTTGESPSLSLEEIKSLIQVAREEVNQASANLFLIVGNGSIGTQKTIELTKQFDEMDIDAFLTVTPYYVKPTQEGLFQHFTQIANASKKPIILYNVPGRTGCDLLTATTAKLAEHENIIGIKDATGDLERLEQLKAAIKGDFSFLSGDDETSCDFVIKGGQGVISVTNNVVPKLMAEMVEQALLGNADKAKDIDQTIAGLHKHLFVEANPIPVKWALSQLGKINNILRLPLTPLALGQEKLQPLIDQLRK